MKRILFIIQLALWAPLSYVLSQTVLFSEDFESGEIPLNWSQEFKKGSVNWRYENGGYSTNPSIPLSRHPIAAHGGSYNALFQFQSMNSEATKLITCPIQLKHAIKPELHFYHAQDEWFHGSDYYNDYLRVYYKSSSAAPWTLLDEFTETTPAWTERIIVLPEIDLTDDYYLAFEGETHWGWGACIDDIQVVDTGKLDKYLIDISATQASEVSVASGTTNNPILRIKVEVMGNESTCLLNSLVLSSLNTLDDDIASNGVKLFFTKDETFNADSPIGTGVDFSSGQASFSGLNYDLPTGYSYIWVTYDVDISANHRDLLDAKFAAGSINIDGQTYFANEQSPAGSRIIYQSYIIDNFESANNWTLTDEFEYGSPLGLGGSQGNADPTSAYSGTKIIGTDLTGLGTFKGDYEENIVEDQYTATSDTFDFTYYNDLSIRYRRWMNIGVNDEASVDVSTDAGLTWATAWSNTSMVLDNSWKLHEIDITSLAARKNNVRIRYSLGATNDYWQLSGWNIDDFGITGNYISNDVGISRVVSPISGCGHTSVDTVTVIVKNYGASTSDNNIPIQYSFDGNITIHYDTLKQAIPFGDSVQFTFHDKVDLSGTGQYTLTIGTTMDGDEDLTNNGFEKDIYIQPTISEDYTETFETNGGLWMVNPVSTSSWEWGIPGYSITPPSGENLWMTKLTSYYLNNDSSFVESVCYQNENNIRKIIQLKYWVEAESDFDGASLQYSIDNGQNWQLVDTLITDWNWYNDTIQTLNSAGWSGSSNGWVTTRLILPYNITTASIMKFRLAFASNGDNNNIGFAFDDFSVIKAPNDIGVSKIDSFANACQDINPDQLTVTIKNYGVNALTENDTVIVGFDFNNEQIAIDTFRLSADFLPGETIKHTFSEPVDAAEPGNYSLTAYTLGEDDPYFFLSNNDTVSLDFEVYPGPVINLTDTVQTHMPDTVVLETYYDANYDYWWNGVNGTNTYNVPDAGWYYLTVTNTGGNGCSAYDSAYVELLFNDAGADSLIYPIDHCGLTNQEYLTVRVRNYGTDSIASGQKIAVAYELNNGPAVTDTLKLVNTLYAHHSIDFTFTKGPVNLTAKGIYNFKIYTSYGGDTIAVNDTIVSPIEILGRPTVSIGPDKTVQALSYTLDAGTGYTGYYWDNGITTQTREITETGTYWVQVFDENQCDNFDTAYIRLKIRDVSPGGLASPISDCKFSSAETVTLRILNSGTDTVPNGTSIAVSYNLNGGSPVTGTKTLTSELLPGSFVLHTFPGTVNLSNPADYIFEATTAMTGDIRITNDTSDITVYRYTKPVVDFGLDPTEIIYDTEYELNAGYSPYYSYEWQDGFSEYLYTVVNSGNYWVIATDTRTSCYDGDTVLISLVYNDVGITSTNMPVEGCTGEYENVTVSVKNLGTINIGAGVPIYVACDVNGIRVTIDTLRGFTNFAPNATLNLTLSGKVKISTGGISNVAFYTIYGNDEKDWDDTLNVQFDALPGPVIDFGDNNGILNCELPHLLDAGPDQKAYLWQDNSTEQTYLVTVKGTYSVTVTGWNDCITTKTVIINMQSDIDEDINSNSELIVYPNPNNGLFNISFDDAESQELLLMIINNQGQTVYNRKMMTDELNYETIDVQHLTRGVYHIVIITEKLTYQGKIVIQ